MAGQNVFDVKNNPYKAQRSWPPDFAKMDSKEQFRLERRYRRRAKLAYTRPRWNQAVKLTQWGSITFVLGYSVLFMDWGDIHTPFDGIRKWVFERSNSIWTASTTQPQRPNLKRISEKPT
ncbi:hypothetical protein MMC14_008824 [Varicellaria rhodocarpa]|nr:hypothetical protein [Varicellaria rhodocarpa]